MEVASGLLGFVILILIILAIFMPVFVYLNQKYTHQCYKELVKINEMLHLIKKQS